MKLKLRDKLILASIIVSIISVLVFLIFSASGIKFDLSGNFNIRNLAITSPSGEMTINSVSKTTINGKEAIRLYVTVNSGGDVADIEFTQSDLNSALQSNPDTKGYVATKGLMGDISFDEQAVLYPISSKSGYESRLDYVFRNFKVVIGGTVGVCDSTHLCSGKAQAGEELVGWRRPYKDVLGIPTLDDCYCLIGYDKASVKKFQTASEKYYKVTFTIDGLGYTTLTESSRSGYIGSSAFIKWGGDLLSGTSSYPPTTDVFLSSYNLYMQEQGTADKIFEYGKEAKYLFDSNGPQPGTWETGEDFYKRKLNEVNAKIAGVWDEYYLDSWKSSILNGNLIKEASFTSGSGLKVYFSRPTSYPTFTIDLDAKSVGIVKLVGNPQFAYVSNCKFNSNSLGKVNLRIINSGTQTGSFALGFENCNVISGVAMQLGTFTAGTSKDVIVNIQGNTGENTDYGSCNMYVYDINDPSNTKRSYTLNCEVNPDIGGKCSSGQTKCDAKFKNVEKCDGNGNWVPDKSCDIGCTYDTGGNAVCKGNGTDIVTGCKSCGEWALNIFKKTEDKCSPGNVIETKWYNPLSWINFTGLTSQKILCPIFLGLVFVVFIFSLLFGRDIFNSFNGINDRQWLVWTISLLVALVIAWVTYMAFVIGLIMLIVYLVFRALVGGTIGRAVGAVRSLKK
jgi:hypothetical protein